MSKTKPAPSAMDRYRARLKEHGLVTVQLTVPREEAPKLKLLAKDLTKEHRMRNDIVRKYERVNPPQGD